MATPLAVKGQTSTDEKPPTDLKCDCKAIWTLAQQYAMRHIVTHPPVAKDKQDYRNGKPALSSTTQNKETPKFVSNYAVRARRIAAAYAATFLEDFEHGKKELVGRFYWLGLGAFASKQVAVTLESPLMRAPDVLRMYKLLGRGNEWLFNDVLAWFYGYSCGADTFELCAGNRHSDNFTEPTKTSFRSQVDCKESIESVPQQRDGETGKVINDKLGYLQCTPLAKTGFQNVQAWETADIKNKPDLAMSHLLAIAKHEQGEVLQGLVYDRWNFELGLSAQRIVLAPRPTDDPVIAGIMGPAGLAQYAASKVAHALIPNLELVMLSADKTDDDRFKSLPEDKNIKLQDFKQRMHWIGAVAKKYHGLMLNQKCTLNFRPSLAGVIFQIRHEAGPSCYFMRAICGIDGSVET